MNNHPLTITFIAFSYNPLRSLTLIEVPMGPNRRKPESFEQWRGRMLTDTARFIEWGLTNPQQVEWIPRHPVGRGAFSERVKGLFWTLLLSNKDMPE